MPRNRTPSDDANPSTDAADALVLAGILRLLRFATALREDSVEDVIEDLAELDQIRRVARRRRSL